MYSHCLFCQSALGANEAIPHFPIGRRLAFDATRGRLWVVCRRCERWNLTPIEERWEAIEDAERLFREQRLRAQTDNIGMARTRDGTELVRIGAALRPEFAAWRYGRVFGARFRKRAAVVGAGAVVVGGGAALVGAPLLSAIVALGPLWVIGGHFLVPVMMLRGRLVPTKIVGEDGKLLRIVRADLEHAQLVGSDGDPWRLRVKHSYGRQELTGERARRALGALLARANRGGAAGGTVRDATALLAESADPMRAALRIADESRARRGDFEERYRKHLRGETPEERDKRLFESTTWSDLRSPSAQPINRGALPRLPAPMRLALEMALHEDTERRALEGELALLEAAWREAEEIAAIADSFFAPASVPGSEGKIE